MTTKIEFIGDPSCPYCYLGFARFARARAEFGADVLDVHISPFLINPDLPINGLEYQTYLMARYGEQKAIASALLPIQKGCDEDQIPLDFARIKTMPNVINAQRLLHWAKDIGQDEILLTSLQHAHFVDGMDIGDDAVLRARAEMIGMDGQAIGQMLALPLDDELIRQKHAEFIKQGIRETPTWIIGGTYVVTGVQSLNFWRNVIGEIDEKGRALAAKFLN